MLHEESEDAELPLPEEDSESDCGMAAFPSVWCRKAAVLQRTQIFPSGGVSNSIALRCRVHRHPHHVRDRVDGGLMWVLAAVPGARTNSLGDPMSGWRHRGLRLGSTSSMSVATR